MLLIRPAHSKYWHWNTCTTAAPQLESWLEETDVKWPKPENGSWFHISVHWKMSASQLLFKGSKNLEITEHEIRTEERVVHNLQAAISTVTCHKSSWQYQAQWLPFLWTLKKHTVRTKFTSNTDMKQAVTSWLQTLDTCFFSAKIRVLVPWCDKCLNFSGDCEGLMWPSATHMPSIHKSQNDILGIWVFVSSFFKLLCISDEINTYANLNLLKEYVLHKY